MVTYPINHGLQSHTHTSIYIQQDATLHRSLYLETALHVSGGTTTHHQKRKQLYLQHLVFVKFPTIHVNPCHVHESRYSLRLPSLTMRAQITHHKKTLSFNLVRERWPTVFQYSDGPQT
jgi:hypothetical protein